MSDCLQFAELLRASLKRHRDESSIFVSMSCFQEMCLSLPFFCGECFLILDFFDFSKFRKLFININLLSQVASNRIYMGRLKRASCYPI